MRRKMDAYSSIAGNNAERRRTYTQCVTGSASDLK